MGLETVEILMQIEEQFEIRIPTQTFYGDLLILGELHKHLVLRLKERGEAVDDSHVWQRLRALVAAQLGVAEDVVTPQSHLVDDLGADR